MDDGDAVRARFAGPTELDAFTFDPHLAAARRHLAAEDAHECGLASAVLADQRMDLARLHVKIDTAQGAHAAEGLRDGFEPREFGHGALSGNGGRRRETSPPVRSDAGFAAQNTASLR